MPGGSVNHVLFQFGAFDESLIATYTLDLLQGLEYLHTRQPRVLHRDIKGANIYWVSTAVSSSPISVARSAQPIHLQ